MELGVDIEFDDKTLQYLKNFPSKFLYSMARQTLEFGYTTIPLSDSENRGRLRSSSLSYGVKQHSELDYSIGSQTDYAVYVWNMNNETTKWTTSGTGSEWYARTLKQKKDIMTGIATVEALNDIR